MAAIEYENLFKENGVGAIDFPSGFSFSQYWEGEQKLVKPAMEQAGFTDVKFWPGESDSFGPLTRKVTAKDSRGKTHYFIYG